MEARRVCAEVLAAVGLNVGEISRLVEEFLLRPVTPVATFDFENALAARLRELGRIVLEVVYNRLESETAAELPKQVKRDGQEYSRKNQKSNNRHGVGTLFGRIALARYSCEPIGEARLDGLKSTAPLELSLGIVAGNATPAWLNVWDEPGGTDPAGAAGISGTGTSGVQVQKNLLLEAADTHTAF